MEQAGAKTRRPADADNGGYQGPSYRCVLLRVEAETEACWTISRTSSRATSPQSEAGQPERGVGLRIKTPSSWTIADIMADEALNEASLKRSGEARDLFAAPNTLPSQES
jgi:hypothetical protein